MREVYEFEYLLEDLAEGAGIFGAMSSGFSSLISLATYVLTAFSLYTIARRRGIARPWMAWIPVVQLWILGSISDDYQRAALGKEQNRRKVLLWLQIANAALTIALVVMVFTFVFSALAAGLNDHGGYGEFVGLFGSISGIVLLALAICGLSIAVAVFRFMALYDVYRSCQPDNAVLFLILNIFIPVTQPILLFACRNKDEGMPKIPEPPQFTEPWETE